MSDNEGRPPPRRRNLSPPQPTVLFDDDEDDDFTPATHDSPSSSSDSSDNEQSDIIEVEIRSPGFSTGSIVLPISKYSTILDLKRLILEATDMEFKLVRLILNGKILDDLQRLEQCGIRTGTILHCAFSDAATVAAAAFSQETQRPRRQNLRGFERLRAAGVSDEDIEHLRWQLFLNQEDDPSLLPQEGVEDMHDVEDRWLRAYNVAIPGLAGAPQRARAQNAAPDPPAPVMPNAVDPTERDEEGSYTDMFVGMIMGFTLGLIILLWMRTTPSSTSGWTRKKKFGILAGIGCNISFGLIRLSK